MKIMMGVIVLFLLGISFLGVASWETTGMFILFAFTGAYIFHLKVPRNP